MCSKGFSYDEALRILLDVLKAYLEVQRTGKVTGDG